MGANINIELFVSLFDEFMHFMIFFLQFHYHNMNIQKVFSNNKFVQNIWRHQNMNIF